MATAKFVTDSGNESQVGVPASTENDAAPLSIYQIISKVSEEAGALAPESKGGVPFAFRGIDGTVAHLSPVLRKYGVVVVPTVIEHKVS